MSVGLFEGTTLITEKPVTDTIVYDGDPGADNFTIIALDDGIKKFSIRATFNADSATVIDNQEIHVTIDSLENGGGSKFKFDDGRSTVGQIVSETV